MEILDSTPARRPHYYFHRTLQRTTRGATSEAATARSLAAHTSGSAYRGRRAGGHDRATAPFGCDFEALNRSTDRRARAASAAAYNRQIRRASSVDSATTSTPPHQRIMI